jgi:hypothetical protein
LNLQWDQGTGGVHWVTLLGESPYSTTDSYTVLLDPSGADQGSIYKFRVRAYNIHGWSAWSAWGEVLAADVPGIIESTTIAIVESTQVQLSWQVPEANGSPIDAYLVEFLTSSGSYVEEDTYCGGETLAVEASCVFPMSYFTGSPLFLSQGDAIMFRVTARNSIGWQTVPSTSSTGTVIVQTSPVGTPSALILDSSQTDET